METIHKSELDKLVKLGEVEAFTGDNLRTFANENLNEIVKSEGSKDEIMKAVADEIRSFTPFKVIDADHENHVIEEILFVRPTDINKSTYAKKAAIGEIREWNGVKHQKMGNGFWKPLPKEDKSPTMDSLKEGLFESKKAELKKQGKEYIEDQDKTADQIEAEQNKSGSKMSRRELRTFLFNIPGQEKSVTVKFGNKSYSGTIKEVRQQLHGEPEVDEDVEQMADLNFK